MKIQAQIAGSKLKTKAKLPFPMSQMSVRDARRRKHAPLRYCIFLFAILNMFSGLHGLWHVFKYPETIPRHHYISWHPTCCPRLGSFLDFYVETFLGLILLIAVLVRSRIGFLSWMKLYWILMLASTISFGYHHIFGNRDIAALVRDLIIWSFHMLELFLVTYYAKLEHKARENMHGPEAGAVEEKTSVGVHGQTEKVKRCEEIKCEFSTESEKQ